MFALEIEQTGTGPFGPVMVAEAAVTVSGIIAMTGRPAEPVQPQKSNGFGDSVMKALRFVVVPSPGKRIGVAGRGALTRPLKTLRVAPECQLVGVEARSHLPKPTLLRL
ncbi:unannotated protein [freshwater metagenome]|uniref:Unannotated protein n=1 Tax=freshwater metagenome TaxID=449393 RepID=A0A6J7C1E0_9ZZZZ